MATLFCAIARLKLAYLGTIGIHRVVSLAKPFICFAEVFYKSLTFSKKAR